MELNGVKVIDAKKSVDIHIQKRDVKNGSVKDPLACAAALACKRELHASEARLHIARAYLKINGRWLRYRTSQALRSEIIAFDRGGNFQPGVYTLKTIPRKDMGLRQTKPSGRPEKHHKAKRYATHKVTSIRERSAGWTL